jgi:hypothetical protein
MELSNPITGIAGCCARAVKGHANAALPSVDMNCRRPISNGQPIGGEDLGPNILRAAQHRGYEFTGLDGNRRRKALKSQPLNHKSGRERAI